MYFSDLIMELYDSKLLYRAKQKNSKFDYLRIRNYDTETFKLDVHYGSLGTVVSLCMMQVQTSSTLRSTRVTTHGTLCLATCRQSTA